MHGLAILGKEDLLDLKTLRPIAPVDGAAGHLVLLLADNRVVGVVSHGEAGDLAHADIATHDLAVDDEEEQALATSRHPPRNPLRFVPGIRIQQRQQAMLAHMRHKDMNYH